MSSGSSMLEKAIGEAIKAKDRTAAAKIRDNLQKSIDKMNALLEETKKVEGSSS